MRRRRVSTAPAAALLAAAAALLGYAAEARALGFQTLDHGVRKWSPRSGTTIDALQLSGGVKGLSLTGNAAVSFEDATLRALRDRLANPELIEMRTTAVPSGLSLTTGSRSIDIAYRVAGIEVCGFHGRAHELADGSAMLLAEVPKLDANHPVPNADIGAWPDVDDAFARVAEAHPGAKVAQKSAARCWHVADGKLIPVWKFVAAVDGLPSHAVADAYELIDLRLGYFDVTGKAHVHPQNIISGDAVDFDLPDLVGDGTLTSAMFKTYVPPNYQKAITPDHVFNFPVTDARYAEASSYTHALQQYDFIKAMGFEWYGPKPLEIRIHVKPAGRSNNALFVPGSEADGSLPTISIDDGDGKDLQFLALDSDVVSHEFGHHVVYRTLQETRGQSLVLHEGLADFFAFSRTGDACLGESICPRGSGACVLESQCLRTASNSLVYNDALWQHWAGPNNRLGHLHGQLVSGLLWDMRSKGVITGDELARLTLKAVSFFKPNSGFRDFMLSLFLADQELFQMKHAAAIKEAGDARGLTQFFSDVDVTSAKIPLTQGQARASDGSTVTDPNNPPGSKKEKKESKGNENPLKCAVVGATTAGASLLVWLALAFPLVAALAWPRRRQPALAKARARRDSRQRR